MRATGSWGSSKDRPLGSTYMNLARSYIRHDAAADARKCRPKMAAATSSWAHAPPARAAFPSHDIECCAYCGHELAAKAAFGTCFPAWGRAVPGHCILATQLSAGRLGRPITGMISQCHRHSRGTASSLCSAVIGSTCGGFGAISSRPVSLLRSVLNEGLQGDSKITEGENLITPIPDPES
jgi:hypothetical protein